MRSGNLHPKAGAQRAAPLLNVDCEYRQCRRPPPPPLPPALPPPLPRLPQPPAERAGPAVPRQAGGPTFRVVLQFARPRSAPRGATA